MTRKNGVPYQALPELKLTRVQRSSLVIIARARRERPGDEANVRIHLPTRLTRSYNTFAHICNYARVNRMEVPEYKYRMEK